MEVHANTKISNILKEHPGALDAIIGISAHFEKLRNPLIRKLMAARTSVAMACKVAGCTIDDFRNKLEPLGFKVNTNMAADPVKTLPHSEARIYPDNFIELDVRPIIAAGKDPLPDILEQVKQLQDQQALKIINSFEPTPLMLLLKKQGFASYATALHNGVVETFFYKEGTTTIPEDKPHMHDDWYRLMTDFEHRLRELDVRMLAMPLPMMKILETLDQLELGEALLVHHKRVPVFLLPELEQRRFGYRIRELGNEGVQLLIYKS